MVPTKQWVEGWLLVALYAFTTHGVYGVVSFVLTQKALTDTLNSPLFQNRTRTKTPSYYRTRHPVHYEVSSINPEVLKEL